MEDAGGKEYPLYLVWRTNTLTQGEGTADYSRTQDAARIPKDAERSNNSEMHEHRVIHYRFPTFFPGPPLAGAGGDQDVVPNCFSPAARIGKA